MFSFINHQGLGLRGTVSDHMVTPFVGANTVIPTGAEAVGCLGERGGDERSGNRLVEHARLH